MTSDEIVTTIVASVILLGVPLLLLRVVLRMNADGAKLVSAFENEASLRGEKVLFVEQKGALEGEATHVGVVALTDKRLIFRSTNRRLSIDIPIDKIRGVREQSLLAKGRFGGFALMMVKVVDGSEIPFRVQGREKWMAAIREARPSREVADDMH